MSLTPQDNGISGTGPLNFLQVQAYLKTASSSTKRTTPLSPRAAEKRPQREQAQAQAQAWEPDLEAARAHYPHEHFTQSPDPPATALPVWEPPPQQSRRQSFFASIFPFPQPHQRVAQLRTKPSQLWNPINQTPRPTPVALPQASHQPKSAAHRDSYPLLTLPEARRSRQHSPTSLIVEHSPHEGSESARSSIALPRSKRASYAGSGIAGPSNMDNAEEKADTEAGIAVPQEAHLRDNIPVPLSPYDASARDIEAQQPSEPPPEGRSGILSGQNYGRSTHDEPTHAPRHTSSKASLRSAGAYSHHAQTTTSHPNDSSNSVAEELSWGPSHPCYPHLNPHVPLNSPEYANTRIIRIRRDWMVKGDLAPTFSNLYPEILDPFLSEQDFRSMIQRINNTLVEAFDPYSGRNWLDGALAFLTGWFWEDLGGRAVTVKNRLRTLEDWIDRWNREVGQLEGVKIWSLRRTGYTCLDVQIPDPKFELVTPPATAGQDAPRNAGGTNIENAAVQR